MKLLSFVSTCKSEKIPKQNVLEGSVNVERDVLVSKHKEKNMTPYFLSMIMCNVGLVATFRWFPPPLTANTNPNRTVYLNKSRAGYGLSMDGWGWNSITEIAPGSAADDNGNINIGEELLSINGVSIRFSDATLTALLEVRHDGAEVVVSPLHMDPLWVSIAMALGITVACFILIIAFVSVHEYVEKWKKRGTVLKTVKLKKSGDDYGFTMKSGKVTEVTSDSQEGVEKGDVIVRVNGVWVADLDDWRINQLFKTRKNNMTLEVRRKDNHLSYLNNLPYIDE